LKRSLSGGTPDLSTTLKELRITGGEPLMMWVKPGEVIEWFKQHNTDMRFALNSNLGAKDELIDRLVDAATTSNIFICIPSNESQWEAYKRIHPRWLGMGQLGFQCRTYSYAMEI
jgi:hypothetical protein